MVCVKKVNAQVKKTPNLSLHVLMNMVKSLLVHIPHSKPWSCVNVTFADFGGNRNKFSFLLLKLLLYSQSVELPPVLGSTGGEKRWWDKTATNPERMLHSPDWNEWHVEQIQRDSQSGFVDFSDCLSHYRLLTTSPWLSLAVSFSHIFKDNPM